MSAASSSSARDLADLLVKEEVQVLILDMTDLAICRAHTVIAPTGKAMPLDAFYGSVVRAKGKRWIDGYVPGHLIAVQVAKRVHSWVLPLAVAQLYPSGSAYALVSNFELQWASPLVSQEHMLCCLADWWRADYRAHNKDRELSTVFMVNDTAAVFSDDYKKFYVHINRLNLTREQANIILENLTRDEWGFVKAGLDLKKVEEDLKAEEPSVTIESDKRDLPELKGTLLGWGSRIPLFEQVLGKDGAYVRGFSIGGRQEIKPHGPILDVMGQLNGFRVERHPWELVWGAFGDIRTLMEPYGDDIYTGVCTEIDRLCQEKAIVDKVKIAIRGKNAKDEKDEAEEAAIPAAGAARRARSAGKQDRKAKAQPY